MMAGRLQLLVFIDLLDSRDAGEATGVVSIYWR